MTLPDTKGHGLDNTASSINREPLKMETGETIKGEIKKEIEQEFKQEFKQEIEQELKEEIKEEVPKGFNEIPVSTHTTPHVPKMLLPMPKVDDYDSTVDNFDREALKMETEETIKEEIKQEIEQETREATSGVTEEAPEKKIDKAVNDEGSTDVRLGAHIPSYNVTLPVDQSWNSLEEACEAILDFIHNQGYGARYCKGPYYRSRCKKALGGSKGVLNDSVIFRCNHKEADEHYEAGENGKRKRVTRLIECDFGVIIMKCLDSWRIVTIDGTGHGFAADSPSKHVEPSYSGAALWLVEFPCDLEECETGPLLAE
ncbi:hypothetical protein N7486_007897 [Penicillium sp. IBT 16267x]|nr:hypothetical protein N7486_007897 [Penicillium sp. IBT 16267x]